MKIHAYKAAYQSKAWFIKIAFDPSASGPPWSRNELVVQYCPTFYRISFLGAIRCRESEIVEKYLYFRPLTFQPCAEGHSLCILSLCIRSRVGAQLPRQAALADLVYLGDRYLFVSTLIPSFDSVNPQCASTMSTSKTNGRCTTHKRTLGLHYRSNVSFMNFFVCSLNPYVNCNATDDPA